MVRWLPSCGVLVGLRPVASTTTSNHSAASPAPVSGAGTSFHPECRYFMNFTSLCMFPFLPSRPAYAGRRGNSCGQLVQYIMNCNNGWLMEENCTRPNPAPHPGAPHTPAAPAAASLVPVFPGRGISFFNGPIGVSAACRRRHSYVYNHSLYILAS